MTVPEWRSSVPGIWGLELFRGCLLPAYQKQIFLSLVV